MRRRALLLSTVSLVALLAVRPDLAMAADPYSLPAPNTLPAVSALNGKIGVFGGGITSDFTLGATGSLAFPLSDHWGGQVDGLLGSAGSGVFYGVGGHLFWRDPAKGLIGAYASYGGWSASSTVPVSVPSGGVADVSGASVGKVGVEGEAYLGRVSLEGLAAYQYGTASGFAGKATAAYYATDNLRLEVSARELAGLGALGGAGFEWQPKDTSRFSVFATGAVGPSSYWQALGGVKMYFGGTAKSLILRQREDDPDNALPDDLYQTIGTGGCPVGTHLTHGFCDGNT